MSDLPATIGRYRIEALLGQGAMGVVYRAHDPDIDRAVAIKLIRADLLATAERADYLQRFRREAQAAGRCSHPNIVALHDVSADASGNPFLVMEYVQATSLDRLLAAGQRLTIAQAVALAAQVLDALACAHGLGVVHRDIKPANILVLDGLRVKVADFGISRLLASELTQVGAVIGTPSYMSPEQSLGEDAGPQSDLFSVASVLYELLSGRRAFTASSVGALALRLTRETPPPIPGLPAPLQAVLDRGHAKQPDARFASAAAMAAALRDAIQRQTASGQAETILLAPAPARADGTVIDPATARMIETLLSRAVGPIARHLLQRALADAASAEEAVQSLAAGIDDPVQRAAFRRAAGKAMQGPISAITTAGGGTVTAAPARASAIPQDICDRLARDLGRHLGPIATVLVRRAAASAGSVDQLRAMLAAHIPEESERQSFLKGR